MPVILGFIAFLLFIGLIIYVYWIFLQTSLKFKRVMSLILIGLCGIFEIFVQVITCCEQKFFKQNNGLFDLETIPETRIFLISITLIFIFFWICSMLIKSKRKIIQIKE